MIRSVHGHPDRSSPVGVPAEHAGVRLRRQVVHPVFLALDAEDVRVLLVELGQRANAVGTEELVLVEHLRENPPEPLRLDQGRDPPLGHPQVPRARRVDGVHELRHLRQALYRCGCRAGRALPLPLLDHRGRAQGQEPDHGAHLEPGRTAVGQPQQVVVEAVLLVPHAIRPGPVHGRRDKEEVLEELPGHFLVDGVVAGQFDGEFAPCSGRRAPSTLSRRPAPDGPPSAAGRCGRTRRYCRGRGSPPRTRSCRIDPCGSPTT